MTRVFVAVLLALSLTGCALFKPEPWAKQIFAPSSVTDNAACDRGVREGSSKKDLDDKFGSVEFAPKQGDLAFATRSRTLYLLCYATGLISQGRPSSLRDSYTTFIRIQDSAVKRDQIKVQISLEQDGRELVRLTDAEIETEGDDKTWYSFKRFSQNQLSALEQTTSFTIIVNRGLGEERYPINPTNLPGL